MLQLLHGMCTADRSNSASDEQALEGMHLWCPMSKFLTQHSPHGIHAGRCDYWGPFVNRAARFANAAARGGQIMVPAAVARSLVTCLTKQTLSLEGGESLLLVQPDFVPQKMRQRPSGPWVPHGSVHPMRAKRHEDQWLSPEVLPNALQNTLHSDGVHAACVAVLA